MEYQLASLAAALNELIEQVKRIADAMAPELKDSIDAPDD